MIWGILLFWKNWKKSTCRKGSHYPQGNAELSENVSCSNPANENTGGWNGSRFFSTLLMCEYGPENLKITTIENYEKKDPYCQREFQEGRTGIPDRVPYRKNLLELMILFLWMLPRGSILTGCRMCFN